MTTVERLAAFVEHTRYADLSENARLQLKMRTLDALGCAIGALDGEPIRLIRQHLDDFGGRPLVTLIGGGKTAPDRAAFYNGALIRYLDYNDSYLAKKETCHPSDNVAPVLAACEYAHASGQEFLTALAVAYQVQCRLSDVAPVRARGFDHTTQGAYAVAAGVARALRLQQSQIANAIAISGTANNALRVTRTGSLSHWKGLAYPNTSFGATHAAFLAMRGITGPAEVFEGNKGFMDAIAGHFELDWERENLEAVTRTSIKRYNAEFHSQATLEGILELRAQHMLNANEIERVNISTFDVAYHIIGGGEEGDKQQIHTKEEADHSLPYMVAVALLDGEVTPAQYTPERITRRDVQQLLRKVHIRQDEAMSERFPAEMPCHIQISLKSGQQWNREKADFEGFYTRPMSWEQVVAKFRGLAAPHMAAEPRQRLVEVVKSLDALASVEQMTDLLASVR